MEAANRGAAEAGGKSIGLSIELPHEQRPNDYISPELSFMFHYFFMRKLWFAQLAKALIVFPGGFGTMDELWEMLTLMQTGKLHRRNLILIYGRKYWDRVLDWKHMLRCGTINKHEYGLLQFADTVDQAFDRVRETLRNTTSSRIRCCNSSSLRMLLAATCTAAKQKQKRAASIESGGPFLQLEE